MTAVAYQKNNHGNGVRIPIQDLPPVYFRKWGQKDVIPYQFAAYFRKILQQPRYQSFNVLALPSPVELTGFFGCSEMAIFQGFQELQRQGYDYKIQGLDLPILLQDPKKRNQSAVQQWGRLSQELLKPWDMVRNRTRNPLDTHPYQPKL